MKKYKFIGNPDSYSEGYAEVGKVYDENWRGLSEHSSTIKQLLASGKTPSDWIEILEENKIDNIKLSNELFDQLLTNRINEIRNTLNIKAKEYVKNNDRMHNFNVASRKTGEIREKCLAGFRLKHEVSVEDIRNDIEQDILPTEDVVREKYGDIINYYILEEISIIHRIRSKENGNV